MINNVAELRSTLDKLAHTTWTNIEDGRRLGVGMGEVGITDHNMLALRREHPSLLIRKHSVHEEVRTGADWEWWLNSLGGWMCFVFQAKVLNADGRYPGITKGQAEGKPQIDLLLRACLARSEKLNGAVWPLYCFYNNWQGGWPKGVQKFDGTSPYDPSHEELRLYGCAAANAWSVRQILLDRKYSKRRTLRNSYLPISRPWSMIFPDPTTSVRSIGSRDVMAALSSWMPGQRQISSGHPSDDAGGPDPEGPVRRPRRDRLAIYRDPEPINQPPDYVLDLLEGKARSRRLMPLARRVAVLAELP